MNAFDKDYKSQIVPGKWDKSSLASQRTSSARRARMMASDDPQQRMAASGYIAGMGKTDPAIAEKIRKGWK